MYRGTGAQGTPGGTLPAGNNLGDIIYFDGTNWVSTNEGTPSIGDILVFDGTSWVLAPQGGPGGGLPGVTSIGDILFSADGASWEANAQGQPDVNDVLIWDGAVWQPGNPIPNGAFPLMVQANWFVDSVNGLDTNDGSQATNAPGNVGPLRTLRELQRRFEGKISLLTHVIMLTGTFAGQILALRATFYGTVLVTAAATSIVTGVVTAFTALAAPATDAKLTDITTPIVWATRVGLQIRLTSGAGIGAVATVLKDLGANQARVSQFLNVATFASITPAVNDTFVVERFDVTVDAIHFDCLGPGFITVENIQTVSTTSHRLQAAGNNNNGVTLRKCKFSAFFTIGMGGGCNIIGCSSVGMNVGRQSFCVLVGHAFFGDLTVASPYVLFAAVPTCMQGFRLQVTAGIALDLAAMLAIFDLAGANPCVRVEPGSAVNATATIMGIGNTTTGVGISARGGQYCYSAAGTAPTVTGAGGDTSIGGTITTYAAIAAAPQSSIMNANNGSIVGLRSG